MERRHRRCDCRPSCPRCWSAARSCRQYSKITGPKKAEPFVRLLAKHKAQVLEALANSGLRELRELRKIASESLQGDWRNH